MSSRSSGVKHRVLLAASLACLGSSVFGSSAFGMDTIETAQPSTLVSDVHTFVVAEDGSLTEDDETTLRANTPAGGGENLARDRRFATGRATNATREAHSLRPDALQSNVA